MGSNLILRHRGNVANTQIGRFEAVFPNDIPDLPTFVRVGSENEYGIFKVSKRNVQDAIFVAEGSLKAIADNTQVEYRSCGFIRFNWYKIRKDRAQMIAFVALVLAIIGTVIDGSFAIGKSGVVWFHFTENEIAGWIATALWLKIIGLLIVFVKSLLDGK